MHDKVFGCGSWCIASMWGIYFFRLFCRPNVNGRSLWSLIFIVLYLNHPTFSLLQKAIQNSIRASSLHFDTFWRGNTHPRTYMSWMIFRSSLPRHSLYFGKWRFAPRFSLKISQPLNARKFEWKIRKILCGFLNEFYVKWKRVKCRLQKYTLHLNLTKFSRIF